MANRSPYIIKPPCGAQVNQGHPLSQGLMVEYLLGEGGGSVLVDSTGRNQARLPNGGMWFPGKFGPAVRMGSAAVNFVHGRVPYRGYLNFSSGKPFTACCWVYYNGSMTDSAILSQFTTGYSGWMIWTGGGASTSFKAYINAGARVTYTLSGVGWHHVALVYDTTKYYLYDNGRFQADSGAYSTAPANGTNDVIIGGYFNSGTDGGGNPDFLFQDKMEDVRIYNRALAPYELQLLYTQPFANFLMPRRRMIARQAAGGSLIINPLTGLLEPFRYVA